ncbi:hypothetical protein TYRP_009703 [Tyrophagus putrescentiae]|nr:hypothetical protein TYRP_009703 [Tyrophagus putrescentiae]
MYFDGWEGLEVARGGGGGGVGNPAENVVGRNNNLNPAQEEEEGGGVFEEQLEQVMRGVIQRLFHLWDEDVPENVVVNDAGNHNNNNNLLDAAVNQHNENKQMMRADAVNVIINDDDSNNKESINEKVAEVGVPVSVPAEQQWQLVQRRQRRLARGRGRGLGRQQGHNSALRFAHNPGGLHYPPPLELAHIDETDKGDEEKNWGKGFEELVSTSNRYSLAFYLPNSFLEDDDDSDRSQRAHHRRRTRRTRRARARALQGLQAETAPPNGHEAGVDNIANYQDAAAVDNNKGRAGALLRSALQLAVALAFKGLSWYLLYVVALSAVHPLHVLYTATLYGEQAAKEVADGVGMYYHFLYYYSKLGIDNGSSASGNCSSTFNSSSTNTSNSSSGDDIGGSLYCCSFG